MEPYFINKVGMESKLKYKMKPLEQQIQVFNAGMAPAQCGAIVY